MAIIYLQTAVCPSLLFISSGKVPLPLFGFLTRGVYLVPPYSFLNRLRHCGTFIGIHTISIDLGIFPAVSLRLSKQAALAYDFARHEHYRHLSLCEHGLSSTIVNYCSDYPNAINDTTNIICNFKTNSNVFF